MTNAPSAKERPTATPRPASTFPDDVPSAATAPSPGTAHGVTSTGLTVDRKAASRQEKSATSSMTGFHTEEDEAKLREETMPKGARLYLLMLGLALATYLIALDMTIINPAIPIISNQFNALQDVGWFVSAYFATSTAVQPLFGRIYRLNLKWPFLACIVVFEIGSIICGIAQDSVTFIVGRAIAGAGLAGGYIGTMLIVADSVPLAEVPKWSAMVGAVYGLGAISGPLIGGAFTTKVTWRWCFYINLPVGAVTIATILLFFHPRPRNRGEGVTWLRTILALDWFGTALALGAMISFLLAMQDGGTKKAWSSSQEIGLLVGSVVMTIAFFIDQWWMKDNALIPLRVLKQRGIWSSAVANIGIGGCFFIVSLMLPIYFQLRGSSSIRSGVQTLPQVFGNIFAMTLAGAAAPVLGYVQPLMFFGSTVGILASGLLQLWNEGSSQAMWAGVSFILGMGTGTIWQAPFILSQTVGHPRDTEIGSSIVIFFQTLGGAVFVGGAQAIYTNVFKQNVLKIEGINQEAIISAGVTGFRSFVPADILPRVVAAAMDAFRNAVIAPVVLLGLTLIASFFMPWNSLKGHKVAPGGA